MPESHGGGQPARAPTPRRQQPEGAPRGERDPGQRERKKQCRDARRPPVAEAAGQPDASRKANEDDTGQEDGHVFAARTRVRIRTRKKSTASTAPSRIAGAFNQTENVSRPFFASANVLPVVTAL